MASLARLYKWPISLFARGSHVDISNFIREIVLSIIYLEFYVMDPSTLFVRCCLISHISSVSSHISHLLVSFRLNLTIICLSVSVPQRSKLKILSTLGIIAILGYTCMHSVCN